MSESVDTPTADSELKACRELHGARAAGTPVTRRQRERALRELFGLGAKAAKRVAAQLGAELGAPEAADEPRADDMLARLEALEQSVRLAKRASEGVENPDASETRPTRAARRHQRAGQPSKLETSERGNARTVRGAARQHN